MTKETLKVAVAQMTSTDEVAKNLEQMAQLVGQIQDIDLVDLIVFPENALFFRISKKGDIPSLTVEDAQIRLLKEMSDRHQVTILVGSAPMLEKSGRVSNASVWIEPGQTPQVVYRKIHLFDVDVAGASPVRESDSFEHGREPKIIEFKGWRLGLSICYDLRFAELYLNYAKAKVDAILIPSAFLVPTGEAHWHVLTRARAIESQAYVIAPAQGGEHLSSRGEVRRTYGHSLAIDPWGVVLGDLGPAGPRVQVFDLERARLNWVRSQIPQSNHRRLP